ncbi:type II secretion system minor pseudopilin GspI [Marinobacter psychrophilus]|uniref:type II secretion system minor pseudopilin GspI n=1 Tax=Marinobacter psychrophilus TaxID=330734 RepID=UPI001B6B7687|nr:type II secretion system minor pseudopilin GspI [Marinobacter psychrophilus]MBQ0762050.1 type II secretion system minor pseudopilin GspI [Marinobacter psychrophilus]MBQ0844017.1 type II secretion system minor pseudopilin GspI [Marinobacter psychrophilus]
MKRSRGFTLIEVLVALLIFGLIATAAAQVGSQYIASYERVRDKTLAAWLAENRINEIRLQSSLPATISAASDQEFGPYRWQVITRVTATADANIRRVEVSVGRYRDESSDPDTVHSLAAFVGAK